jgi:hypothetical protein
MRSTLATVLAAIAVAALPGSAPASTPGGGGDLSNGPSCAVSCITSALIEPHTTAFGVSVRTDTPARIFVGVSKLIAPEGSWIDSTQSGPGRTSWTGHVSGLQPDTLYKVTVSATDSQSRTERRSTFFRTRAVETNLPQGPGDLQSNVGCSAQCISAARLNPEGTGAELSVDTTVPAKLTISADREAPGTIGDAPIFGTPEDTVSTTGFETGWNGRLDRLVPGATYHVILRATDAAGHVSYRQGIFKTDTRRAKLVPHGIRIYYDGDTGLNRGELSFATALNHYHPPDMRIPERKTASGNWIEFPSEQVSLGAPARELHVAVQARERDNAASCSNQGGSGFWEPDNGRVHEWCNKRTWVTARGTIDLDAPVPGSDASSTNTGEGRHEFEIMTSNSAGIRFVVFGHVDVRYE